MEGAVASDSGRHKQIPAPLPENGSSMAPWKALGLTKPSTIP
jgi:hypothetical protein